MTPNFIVGDTKRCNGPLHKGEYLHLSEFWTHRKGERAGKPFSQCIRCENFNKWGREDIYHGLVEYKEVKFIFDELVNRIGKAETVRRLGISSSFFSRRKHRTYKRIRKGTVAKAMVELKKCREAGEARHRKSIRHGSAVRGRKERIPIKDTDYNGVNNKGTEIKRNFMRKKSQTAKLTS